MQRRERKRERTLARKMMICAYSAVHNKARHSDAKVMGTFQAKCTGIGRRTKASLRVRVIRVENIDDEDSSVQGATMLETIDRFVSCSRAREGGTAEIAVRAGRQAGRWVLHEQRG